MVTTNVDNLSEEFENIIEDRDVVSIGTIGLAGAAGGVVATQLAGRVAPILGLDVQPTNATGLLANGTVKMVVGALLGYGAVQVGGLPGLILGMAGIGALILGGGDWINATLSTDVGVPSAQTRYNAPRARATSGNASARVVSSSQNGNPEDDIQFRQGSGGMESERVDFR